MENMYQNGDHVRYGSNGVCIVSDTETIVSPDRRSVKTYYVLRPVAEGSTKIFVPLDNPVLLGRMHPVLKRHEIDSAIRESALRPLEWISERNRRAECFRGILKSADPLSLLQLCCCIHNRRRQLLQEGKHLSGSDEAVLKQAEKAVENEFSFSLGIRRQEVGGYIHDLWKQTAVP